MIIQLRKWGNSLAVRIPRSFAEDAHLTQDSPVDVSLREGAIVLSPVRPRRYRLDDLLRGVNRRNLHAEAGTGKVVGKEVW